MQQPLYIIDGSAYIYRAYHAIGPLSNKDGLPTHAVFGFTNILLRVIREKRPQYIALAFDARGPNFRHEIYPNYKANRPPMPEDLVIQIPYIKDIVKAYNILSLEQGGVEADDIIASAARAFQEQDFPVVVVSGDKDLYQLVSSKVKLWDPMNDRIYDPDAVQKKYNVSASQLTDFFALIGDSSDNVPGVAGIGPKTADKLINQFGTLDDLYTNLDKLDKPKLRDKLTAEKERAFMSRELISLKDDVHIPTEINDYAFTQPDEDKLREIFTNLGFSRLIKSELSFKELPKKGFKLVNTREELLHLTEKLKKASIVVLDTETTSLDPLSADLVGLSVCVDKENSFYIPTGHKTDDGNLRAKQLPLSEVLEALRPFLVNAEIPKLCHNLKYDYAVLQNHGIILAGILWDSMIASYLIDPSRRTHKLDDLSEKYLERRLTTYEQVTKKDKRADGFAYVALEDAKKYSCEDVHATLLLWEILRPKLEEFELWHLFAEVEMELVPILAEMERTGILVDLDILKQMSEEFSEQIDDLEQEIFRLAGQEFNVSSPRQLGEILFEKLNLPQGRKTKTGYSTDVKVLEKLSLYHDLPAAVIAYRNLKKLKSTYVDKLQEMIHPRTGRVHTSFNQTVTATGRLSSSNPNLQNIPIRTPEGQRIREAFIAAPGHLFLAADYSQIDLRVLAHYSQDGALVAAFRAGKDIHSQTAAEIFNVNSDFVTGQMRRVAKTINFGIVYGMSAFGLASQLNLSRKEAKTFIDRYFGHFAGVKSFMEAIVSQAREDRFVTTLLNRRRMLPDIKSPNKNSREFAERTAINTPIQGTAADIIKLATIKTVNNLKQHGLSAKLLLQIHDELVFEVPEKKIEQAANVVKEDMEKVMPLDVPLIVNISTGKNLAEL